MYIYLLIHRTTKIVFYILSLLKILRELETEKYNKVDSLLTGTQKQNNVAFR